VTRTFILAGSLILSFAISAGIPVCSQEVEKSVVADQKAQKAFDHGEFGHARRQWLRALQCLEQSGQKDALYESCLRKLGSAYLREQDYAEASDCFKKASELTQSLGIQDPDLAVVQGELSTVYRTIDIDRLGKLAADVMKPKQAILTLCKGDTCSNVSIKTGGPL
jgi:tetratricopeptide (TPR) repeat protein